MSGSILLFTRFFKMVHCSFLYERFIFFPFSIARQILHLSHLEKIIQIVYISYFMNGRFVHPLSLLIVVFGPTIKIVIIYIVNQINRNKKRRRVLFLALPSFFFILRFLLKFLKRLAFRKFQTTSTFCFLDESQHLVLVIHILF